MTPPDMALREALERELNANVCSFVGPYAENREEVIDAILAATSAKQGADTAGERMKPWNGGETAPDDWDGGDVLMRDPSSGEEIESSGPIGNGWNHEQCRDCIVIAYTPKPATIAADGDKVLVRANVAASSGQDLREAAQALLTALDRTSLREKFADDVRQAVEAFRLALLSAPAVQPGGDLVAVPLSVLQPFQRIAQHMGTGGRNETVIAYNNDKVTWDDFRALAAATPQPEAEEGG